MFQNLHPKCANPACVTAFDWLAGDKLFRYRRNPVELSAPNGDAGPSNNPHRVEHFWLCERCSHIYTLDYDPRRGVLIRLLWPELPAAEDIIRLRAS